ncbi:MAG: GntR family transcriptional regulator [Treponema sp.]|nr:GntR family transcriptional regulator [Treponema sp.]
MAESKVSVYYMLRRSITNLVYAPGQVLDINSISDELGVSRSPVRDALLRLASEKLVNVFPQKGTRVSLLNRNIIYQERFMRITLELGILEQCLKNLSDPEKRHAFVTKLKGLLLAQHASVLDNDKIAFLKYDDDMHHLLYTQAECEWIWETLVSKTGNDHRVRLLSYKTSGISEKVKVEHKELIDAISIGDIELAKKLDRNHLERLYDEINVLRESFPEYFEK